MKKFILSKHKGNVGDILGTTLCIFIMLTLLTVSIQYMKILTVKRQVDEIAREAVLILETQGNLTATDISDLSQQLEGIGFRHYTLTYNDTNEDRSYGDKVVIDININATASEMGLVSAAGLIRNNYNFNIHLVSVCKALR